MDEKFIKQVSPVIKRIYQGRGYWVEFELNNGDIDKIEFASLFEASMFIDKHTHLTKHVI